jgi:serine/threonine-protein kinase
MIGRTIGKYRVLRKIGEGGMGTVYETVHTVLGRRAAVKTLHRSALTDANAAARFFNEAKAISMVSHPCLVTIFEHGLHAKTEGGDDEAYIVMEYIQGESLRAHLDKRYLGGSALELGRQLASALTTTHKQRIVHRDLKPDNIMLVADDTVSGGLRPKILDFGLAKLLPQPEPRGPDGEAPAIADLPTPFLPRSVKTRTGLLMGTPMYMSPEQCRGSGPPDEKSDVYSLGIILYELLYGQPPFVSDYVGELCAMHLFAVAPELRKLVPGINPKLAELVHRMLDKNVEARPSMEELFGELQALPSSGLTDGPVESRPSASQSVLLSLNGHVLGISEYIRRQLTRRASRAESARAGKVPPSSAQLLGAASQGEQVAAQRLPHTLGKVAAGGFMVAVAAAGLLLWRHPLQRPAASPAVAAAPAPAPGPEPPPAPGVAPPPSPPPDAAKPAKKSSATVASSVAPPAKAKSSRKTADAAKKARKNYRISLWK